MTEYQPRTNSENRYFQIKEKLYMRMEFDPCNNAGAKFLWFRKGIWHYDYIMEHDELEKEYQKVIKEND